MRQSYIQIAANAVREEALLRSGVEPLSPLGPDGRFVVVNGDQVIRNLRAHVDEVLAELCGGISRGDF